MEQTEKELFNKRLSGELLMRQQDILYAINWNRKSRAQAGRG